METVTTYVTLNLVNSVNSWTGVRIPTPKLPAVFIFVMSLCRNIKKVCYGFVVFSSVFV